MSRSAPKPAASTKLPELRRLPAVRKRWLDITARWQDEDGNKHEEHLHGWPARIFQHETDHLSGELYIDQAEIRSLTTNENLEDFWCEDPVPTEAAAELGFEL